jgi:integrase
MRLPNGFGSVYKLSGNRRKPFVARITVDKVKNPDTGKAYLKYRVLGYFEKRAEALQCLADYNKNPYSVEVETVTFKELYEKWAERKLIEKDKDHPNGISKSNINGYRASYKSCEAIYDMRFIDIKTAHLQSVMDSCGKGHGTRRKLKVLFGQLYSYAMQNDIVNKNYAEFVDVGEKENTDKIHKPFTKDEIQLLWDNLGRMDFIDTVLIMIYTGLRPGELILILNKDINLEDRYMKGGLKTDAGKDRVIPINKKILPLIKNRMSNREYLILNHENDQMSYFNYYEEKWKKMMEQLNLDHLPHDGRHTFATLMDNAGANKLCIKRIMGHASQDITDKVYTHKDIEELIQAIDLI